VIEPGSKVGRFRIERPLGQGAMGNVYLAIDPEIERAVAIKIVRADLTEDDRREEVETRFLREAKIAGRLQHPNIVTIYDVGRDAGRTFIAMEYVEGRPLSRLLRPDVPLTHAQRLVIARQTAEALAHAHERQVVHRDVKPGNILIRNDGVVKVSDFGIGKLLTGGADVTRTGMMVGSPSYMSPEQIRGDTLDGRSDIFSLGVVLYEMFTGTRPFPGDSVTSLVYQILHTAPRDPVAIRPDLPPLTTQILKRALAKKREDRYANARELMRDLERAGAVKDRRDSVPTSIVQAFPVPAPTPIPVPGAAGTIAAAAVTAPVAASGSSPTVIVEKRGGAALLFGIAALVLAAAAFLFVVTQGRRSFLQPSSGGRSTATAATSSPATPAGGASSTGSTVATTGTAAISGGSVSAPAVPSTASASNSASTASSAPVPPSKSSGTSISTEAARSASPEIGRPKENARKTERSTDTATARPAPPRPAPSTPVAVPAAPPAPVEEAVVDNVYRTRRSMKFQISPDQARLHVDGKYVGIADDWDDHGGGKTFPLSPGIHRVKASLPGYRDLNLQVIVTPSADKDVQGANDEMKRTSRETVAKIGKLDYATEGDVFFDASLASARVVVDGHETGVGFQFTAAQPLKLSGPAVHDLLLTDGPKSKTLRILAASTAGKNRVLIKETLK